MNIIKSFFNNIIYSNNSEKINNIYTFKQSIFKIAVDQVTELLDKLVKLPIDLSIFNDIEVDKSTTILNILQSILNEHSYILNNNGYSLIITKKINKTNKNNIDITFLNLKRTEFAQLSYIEIMNDIIWLLTNNNSKTINNITLNNSKIKIINMVNYIYPNFHTINLNYCNSNFHFDNFGNLYININNKCFFYNKFIGSGSYGYVYKFVSQNCEEICVKIGDLEDELEILSKLNTNKVLNKYIVNCLSIGTTNINNFKNNIKYLDILKSILENSEVEIIIMDYMDCDLSIHVLKNKLTAIDKLLILKYITKIIIFYMQHKLYYTDIKLNNLLCKYYNNEPVHICLGDLGGFYTDQCVSSMPHYTRCIEYLDNPGVFKDPWDYDLMWSLGGCFCQLLNNYAYKYFYIKPMLHIIKNYNNIDQEFHDYIVNKIVTVFEKQNNNKNYIRLLKMFLVDENNKSDTSEKLIQIYYEIDKLIVIEISNNT